MINDKLFKVLKDDFKRPLGDAFYVSRTKRGSRGVPCRHNFANASELQEKTLKMRQVVTLLLLLDLTPTSDKRLFASENAPIRCKNRPYIKGNKKIKVKKN